MLIAQVHECISYKYFVIARLNNFDILLRDTSHFGLKIFTS